MLLMNDFSSYDALSLAELVRSGHVSARELVLSSIENIETLNPRLNAVVHKMYDRALQEAHSPGEGPFSGVPFVLKDLLSWYAGEPVTSGSRFFKGWIPPYDTEMVKRYRRSGVIVVGKTNTPEFGLTPYTEPELFGRSQAEWFRGQVVATAADRFEFLRRRAEFSDSSRRVVVRLPDHSLANTGRARQSSIVLRDPFATAPQCSMPFQVPMLVHRTGQHLQHVPS